MQNSVYQMQNSYEVYNVSNTKLGTKKKSELWHINNTFCCVRGRLDSAWPHIPFTQDPGLIMNHSSFTDD